MEGDGYGYELIDGSWCIIGGVSTWSVSSSSGDDNFSLEVDADSGTISSSSSSMDSASDTFSEYSDSNSDHGDAATDTDSSAPSSWSDAEHGSHTDTDSSDDGGDDGLGPPPMINRATVSVAGAMATSPQEHDAAPPAPPTIPDQEHGWLLSNVLIGLRIVASGILALFSKARTNTDQESSVITSRTPLLTKKTPNYGTIGSH